MRAPQRRFTVRSLMIWVAAVAGVLAIARPVGQSRSAPVAIVLGVYGLVLLGADGLVRRGHRRIAAVGFWTTAILANVVYAVCCISPNHYLRIRLAIGWAIVIVPTLGELGWAWGRLATWEDAVPRRSRLAVGLIVVVLTLLPWFTLLTLWPLRLAVLISTSALDRLTNRVATAQSVGLPQWAGPPFRAASSHGDAASGYVGLMIEPERNRPDWLDRVRPTAPWDTGSLMIGSSLCRELRGGWWHRTDD